MNATALAITCIRLYQRFWAPILWPPRCRFHPSCSAYALLVLQQDGLWRALPRLIGRLMRCHPWHPGGIDLPPPRCRLPAGPHHD